MRGKSIYLTDREILALIATCSEWCEMMNEGEETEYAVDERLDEGLGRALAKLYKGRHGFYIYRKFLETKKGQ